MNEAAVPPVLTRCPHCGAHSQPGATHCWLCFAAVGDDSVPIQAELASPPEFSQVSEWIFSIASGLLALFLLVVTVGLAMDEPTAAVVFLILLSLPVGATVLRLLIRRQRVGRVSWAERFVTFLVSTVATIILLGLIIVAAVIAFFAWCLMAGPRLNFH